MRSENKKPRSGSFTEAARRAQIIEAAIRTVNELGYARASLAEIARRAKTSKSVLSYHFDGKEELLEQVVAHVFEDAGQRVVDAVEAESTGAGKLAAYIRAEFAYMRANRDPMRAATEILVSHRDEQGVPLYLKSGDDDTALLESIIEQGCRAGEFAAVDARIAAITVTHAIDGALTRSQSHPATDLVAYEREVVRMMLRALGAEAPDG
ncbi:TetR family transcriptional regulator [Nonomuraea polychroma]|uniref:TetR family transcriptional regulator n=1 Tax=Nonomuraea polychroma TaxID=46176 RepID=A0A438MM96_9ACTN|nr:TetR family transcriptional regulator [Nonomuraea polychroma]RVX46735.1 TetR family transcriptional regulator [Nonomuraea polychroma]